jgi:two-component system cell cycle sensor histidine kinase/response regulator CckA
MPGLSGTQTLRLARRTRPDLKAIFCAGYAEISRFDGEIGDDTLLKKPFAPGALAEAVRKVLLQRPGQETTNVVLLKRAEQS